MTNTVLLSVSSTPLEKKKKLRFYKLKSLNVFDTKQKVENGLSKCNNQVSVQLSFISIVLLHRVKVLPYSFSCSFLENCWLGILSLLVFQLKYKRLFHNKQIFVVLAVIVIIYNVIILAMGSS